MPPGIEPWAALWLSALKALAIANQIVYIFYANKTKQIDYR